MIKGWKNSPEWRAYFDAKKKEKKDLIDRRRLARSGSIGMQQSGFARRQNQMSSAGWNAWGG